MFPRFRKAVLGVFLSALFAAGCGSSTNTKDSAAQPAAKTYADPTLVSDTAALKGALGQAGTVILDVRSPASYAAGHIPGALNALWQAFATVGTGGPGDANWGVLKPAAQVGDALAALGINASTRVIVYADAPNGWGEDGRVVWMLRMAGVSNSSMLNGGVTAWTNAGFGLSTATPAAAPVTFHLEALDSGYTVDRPWILANQSKPDVKIIDVRGPEEYYGAVKYGEARGGHLPGAILLPFNTALFTNDPANPGVFKSQEGLEAVFQAAGLKTSDTIVCYCTKGIRSGLMTLALRMAGFSGAVNYDASFYDWAGDGAVSVTNYAEPGLITFAGVLSAQLANPDTAPVVLDLRPATDYAAGHIPGAFNVLWQQFATVGAGSPGDAGWGVLKSAAELGDLLGDLGIDATKEVVAYAGAPTGWGEDGRIVWMLRMAGVTKARMLDGGFAAWDAGGYAVSADASTPTPVAFPLESLDTSYNVEKAWLQANLNTAGVKILDVRAPAEYAGAILYGEKRGGHLPGAINLPFDTTLFLNDGSGLAGYFKSPEALEAVLNAAGLQKTDTIVCYCTKGIRSAEMAMALRMAGYPHAVNYDGSFYEWAGDPAAPVVK